MSKKDDGGKFANLIHDMPRRYAQPRVRHDQ